MSDDLNQASGLADPAAFEQALQAALDAKTKPPGSLGQIEELAALIARTRQSLAPRIECCELIIFAADHGMTASGVSAYPQAVTRAMVENFLSGGAASTVFAKTLGVDVTVVDAGVAGDPIQHPGLLQQRIAAGTANAILGPAMTASDLSQALDAGEHVAKGVQADVVCFGEMGIGNTASASLIGAKLLGVPVRVLVGRGTGLDDPGLERKRSLLMQASQRTAPSLDVKTALMEYGGFEIAMMASAMVASASQRRPVIVDGFIATAAALAARALQPGCERAFIYAHRSAESGHRQLLEALSAKPLLDLDMRLGEGTGALLAWPLVKSAAAMLNDMATFDSAGVPDKDQHAR